MKKYNMYFGITITLGILGFASATQTAFALESASTRYQKGYNDGCAGITVPGSHTSEYLKGYAAAHRHVTPSNNLLSPLLLPPDFHALEEVGKIIV